LLPVEARLTGANITPKLEHGRQTLDLIIDGLATEGFMARTMTTYDLPMVAGESAYTLPDNVLDVFEDAMFVPSDNPDTKHTTSELACKQVDFSTWQSLTTKGTSSTRPTLYLAVRSGATVALKFWPVPSDAGTMRLKVVRLLGGNADGTKNADLQRYWYDYLVWELAHYLAVDGTMPAEKTDRLQGMAMKKRAECVDYSFEHTGTQAHIDYPSQWSRG
jgi:hypothetical protein